MSTLRAHVGNARDVGKRCARAFRRTRGGEERFEERNITFLSLQDMMAASEMGGHRPLRCSPHPAQDSSQSAPQIAAKNGVDAFRIDMVPAPRCSPAYA